MPAEERKRLVVLGCVLGLLIAVFVAKTVFSSDDTTSTKPGGSATSNPFEPRLNATSTTQIGAKPPNQPTTKTTIAAPNGATTTPSTFQVYGTKNPFEPVIQVETPTTKSSPTTNGNTATTSATAGPGTTTTTTPSNNPAPGQTVTLIDVFRDNAGTVKAHIQVASTVYTVGEGATFADGKYRVVSLDAPCGQFLYGDSPFRLCQGEQTLK